MRLYGEWNYIGPEPARFAWRPWLAFIVWCVALGAAFGGEPRIVAPAKALVPPAVAVLTVADLPPDATPDWSVPSSAWSVEAADGAALFVNAMPGSTITVQCKLLTLDGKKIRKLPLAPVTLTWAGSIPAPVPAPTPTPTPTPVPNPTPNPTPSPANADPALVAEYKAAIAADVAAGNGSAEHAAALAEVYAGAVSRLESGDPAARPRTVADLFAACADSANAKGIPAPPYLSATRVVSGRHAPKTPPADPIEKHADALVAWFRRVSAALAAAAKGGA